MLLCFTLLLTPKLFTSKLALKWISLALTDTPRHLFKISTPKGFNSDGIFDRINDENRQSYVDFMIKNPFIAKRKFVNVNA